MRISSSSEDSKRLVRESRLSESRAPRMVRSRFSEPIVTDSLIPTFGVFCLLIFCFVIFSHKLPLSEAAVIGAIIAVFQRQTVLKLPVFFSSYLFYLVMGFIGLVSTAHPTLVFAELENVAKFSVVGVTAFSILTTKRDCRTFACGYLALFALYPVRGALYNYVTGITDNGRIAWNFIFNNPNDLAMTCFLPLGLCGYLFFTEKGVIKIAATIGLVVLMGVQMLTQSRGAMIGLLFAILFFVANTKKRMRTLAVVSCLGFVAIAATPTAVWVRMAGLTKASVSDMSQVDPEGSASGRWAVMGIGLRIAAAHPLTGVGMGTYPIAHAKATARDPSLRADETGFRDAHSMYIRAAAETGFLGLLGVVGCVVGSILYCNRGRLLLLKSNSDAHAFAVLALQASMIAFTLGAIFNSVERSTYFMWQYVVPWALTRFLLITEIQSNLPSGKSRKIASARSERHVLVPGARG